MTKHNVRPNKYYINPESTNTKLGQEWIDKANKWPCTDSERSGFLNCLVEVKEGKYGPV